MPWRRRQRLLTLPCLLPLSVRDVSLRLPVRPLDQIGVDRGDLIVVVMREIEPGDFRHQAELLLAWRHPGAQQGFELLQVIGADDGEVARDDPRLEFLTLEVRAVTLAALGLDQMAAAREAGPEIWQRRRAVLRRKLRYGEELAGNQADTADRADASRGMLCQAGLERMACSWRLLSRSSASSATAFAPI